MYKKYKPEFDYSYTLGFFPTIELLRHRPQDVIEIFMHSSAEDTEGAKEIYELAGKHDIHIALNDKQLARLSLKENVHAIAIFKKYTSALDDEKNHLVLVNPADLGNLGTILRTMLGFEMLNLAMIRPAGDIFNPKAVRSSMGAMFSVNFSYFDTFEDYQASFPGHNLYPFMLGAKTELGQLQARAPYSLIFGNESSGLPAKFATLGEPVYIKHSEKIDSLNLSISVGVGLWELYP